MALTIFPAENYNSFCSVDDADTLALEEIPYLQRKDNWDSIEDIENDLTAIQQKEVLLRQATRDIKLRIGKSLPKTLENDLKLATVLLANYSVTVDMSNENGDGNIKVDEIVGVTKTEYFTPNKQNNDLPDNVEQLLTQYDLKSSSTFKFGRA